MFRIIRSQVAGQYDVRLSDSVQDILLFGFIDFLRKHKNARASSLVLGATCVAVGLFLFFFGRLAGLETRLPIEFPLLILASLVLLIPSVLSGSQFRVYFAEPTEVAERREAEEEIGTTQDPFASLELDSKRLSEYYAINQHQARGSFRWAVFAMFCGFATIIAGIWVFYLRSTPNTFLTSLSTAAGLVTNLVSGLFLYLHNRTQRRSLLYYGQLVRIQQMGLAIRLAETLPTDADKVAARGKIIDELLAIVRLTADRDTSEAVRRST